MTETAEQKASRLERVVQQLVRDVTGLQGVIAELRNQPGFPTDGRQFALKFPMLIVGPEGERYSIVRVAGGHLSTVAAAAAKTDWSNS